MQPHTSHYHIQIYIDDLLILANDAHTLQAVIAAMFHLFQNLGILCHPGKCELEATQTIDFLGLQLHVPNQTFFLTAKQTTRLREKTTTLLAQSRKQRRRVDRRLLA